MKQKAGESANRSGLNIRPSVGPSLQRKCGCGQHTVGGGSCGGCGKSPGDKLRRAPKSAQSTGVAPESVQEVLRTPGQPLNRETRDFMEPRFGHDFSQVRVHADARAAESAQAVNAHAYTVGQNVVFGAGQYRPQSTSGQQLLAHELTHVIQQKNQQSLSGKFVVGDAHDPLEQEADRAADLVMNGGAASVSEQSER
ncbi:MAG: DUF4157 domain-containing protein, partial [Pyrinomonadaceae bacterium]